MTVKTVRPPRKDEDEMSPEEQARADAVDVRCLSLCIGMLERVNGVRSRLLSPTLNSHSSLPDLRGELYLRGTTRRADHTCGETEGVEHQGEGPN